MGQKRDKGEITLPPSRIKRQRPLRCRNRMVGLTQKRSQDAQVLRRHIQSMLRKRQKVRPERQWKI